MNRCTFRGDNSAEFIFATLSNGGQIINEVICSPLRVDLNFEGLWHPGKQTGSHKSVLLFRKWWKGTLYLQYNANGTRDSVDF